MAGLFSTFFLALQNTHWYHTFLQSAIDLIPPHTLAQSLLDVGTGPGAFLEILTQTHSDLHLTGIDPDKQMIDQCRKKPLLNSATLIQASIDSLPEVAAKQYNWITFCSILYILPDPGQQLEKADQRLNPHGQIIILTPTPHWGWKQVVKTAWHTTTLFGKITIGLWRLATHRRAALWLKQQTPNNFARKFGYHYEQLKGFNDLALVEILTKQ